MVGIDAAQIINMQGHPGMVDQTLEKFMDKIDIELADHRPRERHVIFHTRTTRKVDDDTGQRLIERDVTVAVTSQPFFIAPGFGQRLSDSDTDILNRVVSVDMEIANGLYIKVNQAMTGNLIEHVIKKRHASSKLALTGTIKIEAHGDLRLQGVTSDFGLPHGIL